MIYATPIGFDIGFGAFVVLAIVLIVFVVRFGNSLKRGPRKD